MYIWKKCLSVFLVFVLCMSMISLEVFAKELQPIPSDNLWNNAYTPYGSPVKSYLYEEAGNLVRVEYIDGQIIIEYYDMNFTLQTQKIINCDLPKWGGFFRGQEYNFVILGQNNLEEDDSVEVISVIKYDKDWNQLAREGYCSLNTTIPFYAGSLRCAEDDDNLYIHTCHEMYQFDDGLNHQSSMTLAVKKSDLSLEAASGISPRIINQKFSFYVSHSFDQYIIVDQEGNIVTYDHGDAYPRSAVIQRNGEKVHVQKFADFGFDNVTNASLGGLAETKFGYVTAYHYDTGNVFLSFTPKDDNFSTEATQITKLWDSLWTPFATPMLVSKGLDGGCVLWYARNVFPQYENTEKSTSGLCYTTYDANGKIGQISSFEIDDEEGLSDCKPIYVDGKVIWYTTNESTPTFYVLDNGVLSSYESTWKNTFSDVSEDAWYYSAVAWAGKNNIVSGITSTTFGVNQPCSTEDFLTFLWRASGNPEPIHNDSFSGARENAYYSKALIWAKEKGLYNNTSLQLGTPCTRKIAITYLWKLAGSPIPKQTAKFMDISDEDAQAVAWAVETGISYGTSEMMFDPDGICSRAQVITLLYRYFSIQ